MRTPASAPFPLLSPWLSIVFATGGAAQDGTFVETFCIECHGGEAVKGGFDLTAVIEDPVERLWRRQQARARVASSEMPPADADQPTAAEREAFVLAERRALRELSPQLPAVSPPVTVRRLSRGQWRNTIVDLLGVEPDVDELPPDDLGYGFDSIGDALTFSTLHLEKHLAVARRVAERVLHGEDPGNPVQRRFEAEAMRALRESAVLVDTDSALLVSRTTIEQVVELPRDGDYRIEVMAAGMQAGDELVRMAIEVDGMPVETLEVEATEFAPVSSTARLAGGERRIGLTFVNDHYDPKNPDPQQRDRNLRIDSLLVVGPLDAPPPNAPAGWLLAAARGRDDAQRLRRFVGVAARQLWRGSGDASALTAAALRRLRAGDSLLEAERFALTAVLVSPRFLFRWEERDTKAAELAPRELATRLSFFLWASAPDAALLQHAPSAKADERPQRLAVVDRMLADARAERLATDFAAQWLELRSLADRTPDPERFAAADEALRASMRRETELLFLDVLRRGADVRELLDCDHTFVDASLARFYGLPEPVGHGFERVELSGPGRLRGGVLGHAGVHLVTSNPTRTSPVKRGKWILENLLDQPPSPPPGNANAFESEPAVDSSTSMREQMAQHRSNRTCASCHARMDALGLALENFDAIGRFREADAGGAIDATGELPDGRRVRGLDELKRVLAADPAFVEALAHKLFVYAIGREPGHADRLRLDAKVADRLDGPPDGGGVSLRDLVLLVVEDPAFLQRGR